MVKTETFENARSVLVAEAWAQLKTHIKNKIVWTAEKDVTFVSVKKRLLRVWASENGVPWKCMRKQLTSNMCLFYDHCWESFGNFLLKNKKIAFYFAVAIFYFSIFNDIVKLVYFAGRLSQGLAIKCLHLHIDMQMRKEGSAIFLLLIFLLTFCF